MPARRSLLRKEGSWESPLADTFPFDACEFSGSPLPTNYKCLALILEILPFLCYIPVMGQGNPEYNPNPV